MSVCEPERTGLALCDDCPCFNFGAEDRCELDKWPEGCQTHYHIPIDFTCPYAPILKILEEVVEVGPVHVKYDRDRGDIRYLSFWVRSSSGLGGE
jgi:hypothetical protein